MDKITNEQKLCGFEAYLDNLYYLAKKNLDETYEDDSNEQLRELLRVRLGVITEICYEFDAMFKE